MNKDWQDWTKLNLGRGCDPTEIRGILESNGFSASDIKAAMNQGGESFWSKTTGSDPSGQQSSAYVDSKGKPIPRDGIQPDLDYAAIASPNLLKQPGLQTIDAEGIQLYVLDDFMSTDECAAIVDVMDKSLRPSTITSGTDYGNFRTSSTCDLGHQSAAIVEKIDNRIARTLGVRLPWSEVIQGQKYEVGQEFKAHTDYFEPGSEEFKTFAGDMGQRTWTFMVYLDNTSKGGATNFTAIDKMFFPKKGRAVIWNNLTEEGRPNPNTMHHGMPVEEGTKVIITKWFRARGKGAPLYSPI